MFTRSLSSAGQLLRSFSPWHGPQRPSGSSGANRGAAATELDEECQLALQELDEFAALSRPTGLEISDVFPTYRLPEPPAPSPLMPLSRSRSQLPSPTWSALASPPSRLTPTRCWDGVDDAREPLLGSRHARDGSADPSLNPSLTQKASSFATDYANTPQPPRNHLKALQPALGLSYGRVRDHYLEPLVGRHRANPTHSAQVPACPVTYGFELEGQSEVPPRGDAHIKQTWEVKPCAAIPMGVWEIMSKQDIPTTARPSGMLNWAETLYGRGKGTYHVHVVFPPLAPAAAKECTWLMGVLNWAAFLSGYAWDGAFSNPFVSLPERPFYSGRWTRALQGQGHAYKLYYVAVRGGLYRCATEIPLVGIELRRAPAGPGTSSRDAGRGINWRDYVGSAELIATTVCQGLPPNLARRKRPLPELPKVDEAARLDETLLPCKDDVVADGHLHALPRAMDERALFAFWTGVEDLPFIPERLRKRWPDVQEECANALAAARARAKAQRPHITGEPSAAYTLRVLQSFVASLELNEPIAAFVEDGLRRSAP